MKMYIGCKCFPSQKCKAKHHLVIFHIFFQDFLADFCHFSRLAQVCLARIRYHWKTDWFRDEEADVVGGIWVPIEHTLRHLMLLPQWSRAMKDLLLNDSDGRSRPIFCWKKMDVAPSTNGKPLICGTLT